MYTHTFVWVRYPRDSNTLRNEVFIHGCDVLSDPVQSVFDGLGDDSSPPPLPCSARNFRIPPDPPRQQPQQIQPQQQQQQHEQEAQQQAADDLAEEECLEARLRVIADQQNSGSTDSPAQLVALLPRYMVRDAFDSFKLAQDIDTTLAFATRIHKCTRAYIEEHRCANADTNKLLTAYNEIYELIRRIEKEKESRR